MSLPFLSKEENELFKKTVQLYTEAKSLILYSEEVDQNSKINPQIWKELRDALDHLMRVNGDVILKNGDKKNQNPAYYQENIEKAHGHIYRACFDALDGAVLSLNLQIKKIIDGFSRDILIEVIEGYSEKRYRIEEIRDTIAKARLKKDVACTESSSVINEYIGLLDELKKIHKKFILSEKQLVECKKSKQNKNIITTVLFLASITISAIVTVLVTNHFQKDNSGSDHKIMVNTQKPVLLQFENDTNKVH